MSQHRHEWHRNPHAGPDAWACPHCGAESTSCQTCRNRPTETTLPICRRCIDRERDIIDAIADHATNITDPAASYTTVRSTRFDLANTKGAEDPNRLPFGWDVFYDDDYRGTLGINTAEGIWQTLAEWADTWAEARNDHGPRNDIHYLKTHIIWAATNPHTSAWDDYRVEIRQLHGRAYALDPTTPEKVGAHCLDCGGPLTREWTKDGLDDTVACDVCGRTYTDQTYRLAMLDQIRQAPQLRPDALITEPEARKVFPHLGPTTIRQWIKRDRDRAKRAEETGEHYERVLPERGRNRRGETVYRVGDIAALATPIAENAGRMSA